MGADLLDFAPAAQVPTPFRLGETVYACFGEGSSFYYARITKIYTRAGQMVCDVAWLRPQAGTEGGKLYAFDDGQEDTMHREGLQLAGLRRVSSADSQSQGTPLRQPLVCAQQASGTAVVSDGSSDAAFADMLGEPVSITASVDVPHTGPDLFTRAAIEAAAPSSPSACMLASPVRAHLAQSSVFQPPVPLSPVAQLQVRLASMSTAAQTPPLHSAGRCLEVPQAQTNTPYPPQRRATVVPEAQTNTSCLQRRATTGSFVPAAHSANWQSSAHAADRMTEDKFGFVRDVMSASSPLAASRKSCC